MRGSIFRRCFPDYEDTAFLLNNQPVVVEEDTQDVQLVHRGAEIVAFTGAELDGKVTSSLQVKSGQQLLQLEHET